MLLSSHSTPLRRGFSLYEDASASVIAPTQREAAKPSHCGEVDGTRLNLWGKKRAPGQPDLNAGVRPSCGQPLERPPPSVRSAAFSKPANGTRHERGNKGASLPRPGFDAGAKNGLRLLPRPLDESGYHRINATGKDGAPRYNHHYLEFARLKKQKYFPRQKKSRNSVLCQSNILKTLNYLPLVTTQPRLDTGNKKGFRDREANGTLQIVLSY